MQTSKATKPNWSPVFNFRKLWVSTITGNPAPLAGDLRHLPPHASHQKPYEPHIGLQPKLRQWRPELLLESLTELGTQTRNQHDECEAIGIAEEELGFTETFRPVQLFQHKQLANIAQLTFQSIMTTNTLAPVSKGTDGGEQGRTD